MRPRSTSRRRSRRVLAFGAAVAVAAALGGCAGTGGQPTSPHAGAPHGEEAGLPSSHAHGVAVNPADDRVYLATHDGLFRYDDSGPVRVGPVIDLMGFTVAGPDLFYASGHPGPGTDLPEPVGLISSRDGGETWLPVSRQGESDFHALTSSSAGVVGFDGTALRATGDGTTWRELAVPVAPFALTASPDGAVLVATSQSGLLRSDDAGASWARLDSAPVLQVVAWAGGRTVVGVTPEGVVAVSEDAGRTWSERATVAGPPQAVGATLSGDGTARVLVVTSDAVLDSRDGGTTFEDLRTA